TVLTELSSFYAGLAAKSGDRAVGEAFYDSWTDVLNKYELIPEEIDWSDLSITSPVYGMRPEYPNSSFDLWFLTGNEKYRRTGYQYFEALRKNCRVPNGYTTLKDVRTRPMTLGDHFPAYSFSENFKYLYLMFADAPRFDSRNYYLNTEGKIMRGMRK
ncbi:MAG: glycoside hydrolase family 47 protein, partial [Candidatus Eremiobacteraeota bacterium]|nr:glycoside hydrolase family 47 protein [Candidatus Eremiobacteraeota bacterium]